MSLSLPEHTEERIRSKPALRDDTKFASAKIAFFQYLAVGVFLFLIAGFWTLQVRDRESYKEAAERNRIKFVPLLAPRGKILDRDGRVIVDNRSSYSLMLARDHLRPQHIRPIALGLSLDPDQLEARVERFRSRPKYENIFIKNEITQGEVAFVEAHRDPDSFPELELIRAQRRLYPQNGLAAHVIGYVGEISEAELNSPEFIKYDQGAVIGKAGLERQYNDQLMGVDGQKQVVVDNHGAVRQALGIKEAIPGKNLQLTLDLDLQVVAELAMENRIGAVVALDPRNGEVLAMVSTPAYDPNKFASRIRAADWNELRNNPENPLLNRAIQAQFAPGSTFKPIVALAGLESGAIDENFRVRCPGGASFYGRYFKCHLKGGHGIVDLHKGITQSCDVYFYNVGNRTGIDNIAKYADMAGLGHKTGIDLPDEKQGRGALLGMEDAELPAEMVRRGDDFGGHRPGRADGDPDATGVCHRGTGDGRRLVPAAPGEGPRPDGKASHRHDRPGQRAEGGLRDVRRGQRRRHRRAGAAAGRQRLREDGVGATGFQ